MNGNRDYKVITSDAGQTAYAKAVAEGLIEFLNLKKKMSNKSIDDWAKEVIVGKHGNGHAKRKTSLKNAGCTYSYEKVRVRVNEMLK